MPIPLSEQTDRGETDTLPEADPFASSREFQLRTGYLMGTLPEKFLAIVDRHPFQELIGGARQHCLILPPPRHYTPESISQLSWALSFLGFDVKDVTDDRRFPAIQVRNEDGFDHASLPWSKASDLRRELIARWDERGFISETIKENNRVQKSSNDWIRTGYSPIEDRRARDMCTAGDYTVF